MEVIRQGCSRKRFLLNRLLTGGVVFLFIVFTLVMPVSAKPGLNLVTFLERPLVDAKDEKPFGLVVALTDQLMKRAGVDYSIFLAPPRRALLIGQHRKNYCVFPIERSQEREVFFKWVSPVLISRHGLYANPDRKKIQLKTLDEARPYILGSYMGSGVGEYLESFGFTVHYAARNELNADKLMKNRIDLWVSDTISARFLAKERSLPVPDPLIVFYTSIRAMGCNIDVSDELIDLLQQELLTMYRDKTISRIYHNYDATLLK
ncbi:MAG: amino acid ABC transporter substrate-binding protein [Proteobacteria bacterium]|nr:MAG: amino acid ABC transporter substrate-binding protein [Pseudomonadota bacterium]PIE40044.1 MAG: amino acid ABC transporter substrate-binding protein [Gammaproteobacteria bacterium]